MAERFTRALETIGLSDKEARVYLAALELGPSTAQLLAAKATVNRPTAYIMIESLTKRGLMSSVQKGGKRFFSAAAPEQLLELTAAQRKDLQKKEDVAREILPDLLRFASGKEKPSVRVFEGDDVWTSLQRDMLATKAGEAFDISSGPPACLRGELREDVLANYRVSALRSAATGWDDASKKQSSRVETRTMIAGSLPIDGEVVMYGTKVILISPGSQGTSILIDDIKISATMRAMFTALWSAAA
jgi:sugar-specific transcriptional regulator TrmB